MEKYVIYYYFDKEFYVRKIVESDVSKEVIAINETSDEHQKLVDERGVLHSFNMRDVKLVKVNEVKKKTVMPKPIGHNEN